MDISEYTMRSLDRIRNPFAVVKSRIRFILAAFVSPACFVVIRARGVLGGLQRECNLRVRNHHSVSRAFPEPSLDAVGVLGGGFGIALVRSCDIAVLSPFVAR